MHDIGLPCIWQETSKFEVRTGTARIFRVFPGEAVHTQELVQTVLKLDPLGYAGEYSFNVFKKECVQMPPPFMAQRGLHASMRLGDDVLRRSVPLTRQLRLRHS